MITLTMTATPEQVAEILKQRLYETIQVGPSTQDSNRKASEGPGPGDSPLTGSSDDTPTMRTIITSFLAQRKGQTVHVKELDQDLRKEFRRIGYQTSPSAAVYSVLGRAPIKKVGPGLFTYSE